MRQVWLSGGVPDRISEATRPWEWVANLRISFDPLLIRHVEVIGTGAEVFDAWLDRRLGLVTLAPIAVPDFEAFARDGRAAELSVQLRFRMSDGTVADGAQTWRVAVEDVDDTPPESVAFATGGTVRAGEAGAVIGRLRVTDPDTASGFRFSFLPEDDWMFEVVNGDTLKLRDGVLIPREDAPVRPLIVEVSDGANSSAHVLDIQVEAGVAGLPRGAALTMVGERRGPLFVANDETARLDLAAFQVSGINGYGEVLEVARPGGQPSLWFERPAAVDLLDGLLDTDRSGNALRVALAYDVTLQRAPTPAEMMWGNAALLSGQGVAAIVGDILAGAEYRARPPLSNEAFVRQLMTETVGWVSEAAVPWHAGRLRDGSATRAKVAEDIVGWSLSFENVRARADAGFWVPHAMADHLLALHRVATGAPGYHAFGPEAQIHATGGMLWHAALSISQAPMFQARFGWMDNPLFVDAMYREVLGRGPTWTEFARFWIPLENGWTSRGDVLHQFATSVDTSPVPPNPAPGGHALPHLLAHGIGELLDIVFGAATPAAWRSLDALVALDGALRHAARTAAAGPEFAARYGALDNPNFVAQMFQDAFGRPVDWPGFVRFYLPLESGAAGRADMMLGAAIDPASTAFAPLQRDLVFDLL